MPYVSVCNPPVEVSGDDCESVGEASDGVPHCQVFHEESTV